MKNIPPKIYLQVDADGETPEDFKELNVSWATERVYPNDIEYVLPKSNSTSLINNTKHINLVNSTELVELLQDLKNYMNSRAWQGHRYSVGGALETYPNEEMGFEQRIDAVLRSATAQTKAEVYDVMFDTTQNPES
jgi:hypothetical protein